MCRRPLSYRNKSIDVLRKSVDWFLYDNGLRYERVNFRNWFCSHLWLLQEHVYSTSKKYYSPGALWHRCFPVNFAKFPRTPFLQNTSCGYFWPTESGACRSSNWANVWQTFWEETRYLVNISITNFNDVFIDLSNFKFLFL